MKDRNLKLKNIGIFIVGAVAAASMFVGTQGVRDSRGQDVVTGSTQSQMVQNAAWLEMRPASFADLAEKVKNGVVNISTSKKVRPPQFINPYRGYGGGDPFEDFFEKYFEGGVARERTQKSLGSGFLVDKDGTILTNNHVVSQADEIDVKLADGRVFKAKVVGVDEKTDIAVIKIKANDSLPYCALGSSKDMRPGDWVMAIGNPFGLEQTVTVGVVSATGRALGSGTYGRFIQTDASINPGNSGGPLFNVKGEVIGINTMIYAQAQGIGFAIPVDMAKGVMPDLVSKGRVTRGWLGVAIQELTPELAKSFGLEGKTGAIVAEVYAGSPAAKAGLGQGDVITKFNGSDIKDAGDLSYQVGQLSPNTAVKLEFYRNGEKRESSLAIAEQKGDARTSKAPDGAPLKADAIGISVEQMADGSVQVVGVQAGSAAEAADLSVGDVIQEMNGTKVANIEDYSAAVKKISKGSLVRLLIKRDRASIYLAFRL